MYSVSVPKRAEQGARRSDRGFTMVEILVVVAIIAILTAILLPVLAGVQEKGRRTKCQMNLYQIATAMKLFKMENGWYPAGDNDLWATTPTPTGLDALYPNYIKKRELFRCPNDVDPDRRDPNVLNSYDLQDPPVSSGLASQTNCPTWKSTTYGTRPDPREKRQLCWRTPPDDTVLTWCVFHRDKPDVRGASDKDIIAFLGGDTKLIPSTKSGHQYNPAAGE